MRFSLKVYFEVLLKLTASQALYACGLEQWRSRMPWVWLSLAIVFEVIGTISLREIDGLKKPIPIVIVAISYGVAFSCLVQILKVIPVGIAYAIWSGVGSALVVLAAWIWLKQTLDLAAIIGVAMIIGGVIVMRLFSKTMVL
jgi:small multidrug resistance pump